MLLLFPSFVEFSEFKLFNALLQKGEGETGLPNYQLRGIYLSIYLEVEILLLLGRRLSFELSLLQLDLMGDLEEVLLWIEI